MINFLNESFKVALIEVIQVSLQTGHFVVLKNDNGIRESGDVLEIQ